MNVFNQSFEIIRIASHQKLALVALLKEAVANRKAKNGLSLATLAPLMAACGGGTVQPPPPPPPEPKGKFTLANGNEFTGTNYGETLNQAETDVWLVVDALGGNDTINTGSGADFIDGGNGNDTINSNAGNDMIRGGIGADTIDAGAGNDIIIVVGVTSADQYTSSSITNPAGTGKNLSKLLSLADLNGKTASEVVPNEVIDGGTGTNTLFVYGIVDFTNVTITNVTQVVVNSDVTFADNQLGAGGITKITGDGGSTIRLESDDGTPVEFDLSTLDLAGIFRLDLGSNVTLVATSVNDFSESGISLLSGAGIIKITQATGFVDLSGIAIEITLEVNDVGGQIIDLITTGAILVTETQINETKMGTNDILNNKDPSTLWINENENGASVINLRTVNLDAGDEFNYSVTDNRFEVVNGQLKLKAGISLDDLAGSTLYFDLTMFNAEGFGITKTMKIKIIPQVSSGKSVVYTISHGDFSGEVLHFNDPLLPLQSNVLGFNYDQFKKITDTEHINIVPIWDEYSGAGILIGSHEVIDFTHDELFETYLNQKISTTSDEELLSSISDVYGHGTRVAGIISAGANNGIGLVGIAYNAKITMIAQGLEAEYENVDIITNSTGVSSLDLFSPGYIFWGEQNANIVQFGRNGLGIIWVNSVGNAGENDYSTDAASFQNYFEFILVGLGGGESNFGSALHISAPLSMLGYFGMALTIDRPGDLGLVLKEGSIPANNTLTPSSYFGEILSVDYNLEKLGLQTGDYVASGGTSSAAPIVSGAVAILLEASGNNIFNSTGLGWRDVQEILAISARHTGVGFGGEQAFWDNDGPSNHHPWTINGSTNFNGGGMHFTPVYGFGMLDVHGAVRLAETWSLQRMSSNLVTQTETVTSGSTITYGTAVDIAVDLSGNADLDLDVVSLDLDITHDNWKELQITLISPDGTQSLIMDTPGLTPDFEIDFQIDMTGQLVWTVLSRAFWGENSQGVWTIRIEDMVDNGNSGSIASIDAHFQGDLNVDDDTYFWTDDWALMNEANGGLPTINDSTGNNTINAAAVSDDVMLNIAAGSTSTIGGVVAFSLGASTTITTGITGDGDDTIKGIGAGDSAYAMRGDDRIETGVLTFTRLDGHEGIDTLALTGAGMDLDVSAHVAAGSLTGFEVLDFTASGAQLANLTAADIVALSDTNSLTVMGDASDSITLDDSGWSNQGQTTKDGEDYTIYTNGDATIYLDPDLSVYFG